MFSLKETSFTMYYAHKQVTIFESEWVKRLFMWKIWIKDLWKLVVWLDFICYIIEYDFQHSEYSGAGLTGCSFLNLNS